MPRSDDVSPDFVSDPIQSKLLTPSPPLTSSPPPPPPQSTFFHLGNQWIYSDSGARPEPSRLLIGGALILLLLLLL